MGDAFLAMSAAKETQATYKSCLVCFIRWKFGLSSSWEQGLVEECARGNQDKARAELSAELTARWKQVAAVDELQYGRQHCWATADKKAERAAWLQQVIYQRS